jgi:hypothetical protein
MARPGPPAGFWEWSLDAAVAAHLATLGSGTR